MIGNLCIALAQVTHQAVAVTSRYVFVSNIKHFVHINTLNSYIHYHLMTVPDFSFLAYSSSLYRHKQNDA